MSGAPTLGSDRLQPFLDSASRTMMGTGTAESGPEAEGPVLVDQRREMPYDSERNSLQQFSLRGDQPHQTGRSYLTNASRVSDSLRVICDIGRQLVNCYRVRVTHIGADILAHVHHHHEADHLWRRVEVAERTGWLFRAWHAPTRPSAPYQTVHFALTESFRGLLAR